MKLYTENIDGAKIEKRHSTIIWNYKKAQEEHGSMFAKELSMQIQQLLGNNAPVEIIQGNGFLEVKPKKIKKKKLLKQFLREIFTEGYNPNTEYFEKLDYLLYIGADTSSEPLFEYLNRKK